MFLLSSSCYKANRVLEEDDPECLRGEEDDPECLRGEEEDPADARTLTPEGFRRFFMQAGGLTREFVVYAPRGLSQASPAAGLVLFFHGYTLNYDNTCGGDSQYAFEVRRNADLHKFVAVCPQGIVLEPGYQPGWNCETCCGYAAKRQIDDVGFVSELMDHLRSKILPWEFHLAYPSRNVFAFGFSTGALFSYRLACELPGRFDGIAVLGAAWNWAFGQEIPTWPSRCNASVSTWSGIGTEDQYSRDDLALARWREYSSSVLRCSSSQPTEMPVGTDDRVLCRTYSSCSSRGAPAQSRLRIHATTYHNMLGTYSDEL